MIYQQYSFSKKISYLFPISSPAFFFVFFVFILNSFSAISKGFQFHFPRTFPEISTASSFCFLFFCIFSRFFPQCFIRLSPHFSLCSAFFQVLSLLFLMFFSVIFIGFCLLAFQMYSEHFLSDCLCIVFKFFLLKFTSNLSVISSTFSAFSNGFSCYFYNAHCCYQGISLSISKSALYFSKFFLIFF